MASDPVWEIHSQVTSGLCVHEGWLYTATAVWAVFLRYAGREDRWPEKLRGIFTPKNVEKDVAKFRRLRSLAYPWMGLGGNLLRRMVLIIVLI